jgi:hypothetical protein
VRKGRLEQLHATMKEGTSSLEHDGLWTAISWRMQTRLDGRIVSSAAPLREQPAAVDAGSVAALLILAQLAPDENVPVVVLHPGFDAEPVRWRIESAEEGTFRVRTHIGFKWFRLDARGGIEQAWSKVGGGVIESHGRELDARGGPGLRPPAWDADPSTQPGGG